MTLPDETSDPMAVRLSLIKEHLDERAWRLLLGAEAKALGKGGITAVAQACSAHPDTIAQGVREVDYPEPIPGRIRPGIGRPTSASTDPSLLSALDAPGRPRHAGGPRRSILSPLLSNVALTVLDERIAQHQTGPVRRRLVPDGARDQG